MMFIMDSIFIILPFFPEELTNEIYFFYAVEFDYLKIVEFYRNMEGFDINILILIQI